MEKSSISIDRLGLRIESFYYHINETQMVEVAKHYAKKIRKGQSVFLSGELGGGKTSFVKAVASAYGIEPKNVRSPTFTLINRYAGSDIVLFHLDCYRLEAYGLENIGFFDLPAESSIVFIEWPENVVSLFQQIDWLFSFTIPEDTLEVRNLTVYRSDLNVSEGNFAETTIK